jgi:hypothetical protein
MASQKNGFRPGSKTNWRKRLDSVTRYIYELETCLAQANAVIFVQENYLNDLRRFLASRSEIGRGEK